MRADPFVQRRLLDVQDLDARLGRLAHRRRTLPQLAQLVEIDRLGGELRDRRVAVETAISDLEREQAKAEADVEQVRSRMARDQAMLDAGTVASARQLGDLQHEIESLRRRVTVLEDAELEVMERLEEVQGRAGELAEQVARVDRERSAAIEARDAALAEIEVEENRLAGERAAAAAQVPADLLALYDRIRADRDGVGAAALHRARCQGCQLVLTPADLGRIRSAAADEVIRCEECRRILVRTEESGL